MQTAAVSAAVSSRSTRTRGRPLSTVAASALQLGQEVKDLEVQPDQGDQEAERPDPLHVLRHAGFGAPLDEVEVEDEVQGRDRHHEHAEGDADRTAVVDVGDADAEEAERHRDHVQEGDGPGGGEDAELEVLAAYSTGIIRPSENFKLGKC